MRLSCPVILWLLTILISGKSQCVAKDAPNTVGVGDTIRFTARSLGLRNETGVVSMQMGDSIYVRIEDSRVDLWLTRSELQRLQVRRGRHHEELLYAIAVGGMGFCVGGTLGYKTDNTSEGRLGPTHRERIKHAITGGIVGTCVGALVGVGIGQTFWRPTWVEVSPWIDRKSAQRKSFGLTLTAHF